MISKVALLISLEDVLRNFDEVCLRIDSDTYIKDATNRIFVVVQKIILSDVKKLTHSFGLKWNFCTSRSSRTIKCNRATYHGLRVNQELRDFISITCGYDWSIRFRCISSSNNNISDHIVITSVDSVQSNTCDPSYVGQFVLSRTRSSDYNRCGDKVLREIMVQMTIDLFVNVRVMTELLQKEFTDRKDVDMYMINNVRIRAYR